ncbi:uncharacterized protein LOC112568486 [Pomacea canaliculata]|uniref:uncharacterized protein LOC112568486 n=1 Tax=Pomacea canaliculata TaxID=400727 RepID=UPI000D73EA02|nr:uncharacterized protein LOC112568486 [Pomacea canaliculata]
MAAELSMWSRVCDLLVTKPDLNLLDREGLSVLHRLVMCPDSRFDSLLPVLLENGADVHIKTKKGDTILHLTAKHQKITKSDPPLHLPDSKDQDKREQAKTKILKEYRSQCAESKRQLLAKLISSCQNLDDQDDLGNTAMIVAAKTDNWEFMKLLLEHGARADIVDLYQRSVLHILATKQTFTDALACRNLVTLCLSRGAEVNSRDVYGNSVLHLTVQSRHWILFELLIDCGAEPGHVDSEGYNVFHRLALTKGENTENICLLFSLMCLRYSYLDTLCRAGYTVLHMAASQQNWTLVRHLVHLGANINLYNKDGFNVLHIVAMTTTCTRKGEQNVTNESIENDQTELLSVVDLLIEKGADIEICCSALHLAAKRENWIMVSYLIQRGANLNAMDSKGLHVVQRLIQSRTETSNGLLLFRLLYEKGSLSSVQTSSNDSVLHLAARHEKWTFVDHILSHQGGNVDELDSEGFSVLHRMTVSKGRTFKEGWRCSYVRSIVGTSAALDKYQTVLFIHRAAASGNIDVVDVLFNSFDDVNSTDCNGFTLLHKVSQCCSSSSVAVIRGLLIKGADIDKRCPGGDTALQLAAKSGNWLGAVHLAQSGARTDSLDNEGMSVLHRLIHYLHLYSKSPKNILTEESLAVLLFIFTQNVLTNQKDLHGNTFLHLAVTYKQWHLAVGLLTRGASLGERDSEGYIVLHRLAQMQPCPKDEMETCSFLQMRYSHLDILDFIDGRVFIDARDPYGNTALLLSAENNNWDIFQKLLLKDANPCVKGCNGVTLLHLLAKAKWSNDGRGSEGLLCQLLKNLILQNLDVSARDPEGNTPIQVAAKHGNMDMVERLLEFHDNVNETDSEGFTLLSRVAQSLSPRCEVIAWRLSRMETHSSIAKCFIQDIYFQDECAIQKELLLQLFSMKTIDKFAHVHLEGRSLLQIAVAGRLWGSVEKLLEDGAYTDPEPLLGESVFHGFADWAIMNKDDEMVLRLMPSGNLNINTRDRDGDTPLNILAKYDQWELVQRFVERGADVNMADNEGWTVLHRLAMLDVYWTEVRVKPSSLLQLCCDNGADINMTGGQNSRTAVQMALDRNTWTIFWYLIQLGAQQDWTENEKHLILRNVDSLPKKCALNDNLTVFIRCLIEQSSNRTLVHDIASHSTVMYALQNCLWSRKWRVAKVIVECTSETEMNDLIAEGTLIHDMVMRYKKKDHVIWVSLLDALLERGVDINSRDSYGQTVLTDDAVIRSLVDNNTPDSLFRVLLQRGINPINVDSNGCSLLVYVINDVVQYMLTSVISLLELGLVSRQNHDEDEDDDEDLASPTRLAVETKNIPALKILIECDVSCNSELRALNAEYQLKKVQDAERNEPSDRLKQICLILEQAATQPRSLQSLCRVAVCRCIPWGLSRRDMVQSLLIPKVVQNYLLFADDISHPDVQAGLNEEATQILHTDDDNDDYDEDDDDGQRMSHGQEHSTWSSDDVHLDIMARITETSVMLNSAAEDGNWNLVRELISNEHSVVVAIQQSWSCLLQKFASLTKLSYQLVKDILKQIFSNKESSQNLKVQAKNAAVEAARCGNWDTLIVFLSSVEGLLEDDSSLRSVILTIADSQTLREKRYLHIDVLSAVWRNSKQTILDSTDKTVHNTLVQLAAELNMWSRVCDLLVTKPDLNLLDREGLSVLHRLVMCPDSRFDSILSRLLENGADVNLKTANGDRALHLDTEHQKLRKFQYILRLAHISDEQHGANHDIRDQDNSNVLHRLALADSKHVEEVMSLFSLLQSRGANINATGPSGNTILHLAAKQRNWTLLQHLLHLGAACINSHNENGFTVIHILASDPVLETDHTKVLSIIDLLLEKGADLSLPCSQGNTALHLAVRYENWVMVKYLVQRGLATDDFWIIQKLIQYKNETHETYPLFSLLYKKGFSSRVRNPDDSLLQLAAKHEKWDIVEHILRHEGGNVNELDSERCSVLHRMATNRGEAFKKGQNHRKVLSVLNMSSSLDKHEVFFLIHRAAAAGNIDVVDMLLNNLDDANMVDSDMFTVLQRALLSYETRANILDNEGMTVLHRYLSRPDVPCGLCSQSSPDNLLTKILKNDALINQRDRNGHTPLHLAVKFELWDKVAALLDSGACVNDKDQSGCTALHMLSQRQDSQNLGCEMCRGWKLHLDRSELFIDSQIFIDARDESGNTALMLSAKHNNWDITERLLQTGADPCILDSNGLSVLHVLASVTPIYGNSFLTQEMQTNILELLISRGADVNAYDSEGNTPIQVAAKHGNMDMVERLLKFKDNVNETDSEGFTLLSRVAQTSSAKCEDITTRLLEKGADVNRTCPDIQTSGTTTPLLLSVNSSNWPVTLCLCNAGADIEALCSFDQILHRLMHSITPDNISIILLLIGLILEENEDVIFHRSSEGQSVMQLAFNKKLWDILCELRWYDIHLEPEALVGRDVFEYLADWAIRSDDPDWIFSIIQNIERTFNFINLRDRNGNTPLNILAKDYNWYYVKLFVDCGADVNMPDIESWLPLHRLLMAKSEDNDSYLEVWDLLHELTKLDIGNISIGGRTQSLERPVRRTSTSSANNLFVCVFNARSVRRKSSRISNFIKEKQLDIMFLNETWLKIRGDELVHDDLTPEGYYMKSRPRPTTGGGVAVLWRRHILCQVVESLPFSITSFEVIQFTLTDPELVHFFCIYRPPRSQKNKNAVFFEEFPKLLDWCKEIPGKVVLLGDFNFQYDTRSHSISMCRLISRYGFEQAVEHPTHTSDHIIDWVLHRRNEDIIKSCSVTDRLKSDHFAVLCFLNVPSPK